MSDRMFCIKDHERGYEDVATLYESEVDPDLAQDPGPHTKPVIIEELTTRTGKDLVPRADIIVDQIAERVWDDSGIEDADDWFGQVQELPEVIAAAEALRDAIGASITFYIGDKRVRDHTLSWDHDGNPLLNGEPIYQRVG